MRTFRFNLSAAILSFLVGLLVLIWILLSFIVFKTAEKDLINHKADEARLLLSAFFRLLPADLTAGDLPYPTVAFVSAIAGDRDFRGLLLVGKGGRILFSNGTNPLPDHKIKELLEHGGSSAVIAANGLTLTRYETIVREGSAEAVARLTLSLEEERNSLAKSRKIFLAYFVLDSLLLLSVSFYFLSRFIVSPLNRLLNATERVASGDYGYNVRASGSSEIMALADSFNIMQTAIRTKDEEVAAHVLSLEKANRELQEAREETVRSEKMASVGVLAAGMGHEIGTPLATIMGYATILKEELKGDPVKVDYLDRIEMESTRIDRIVRGLLDYARPAKGDREPLDCSLVVNSVVELLSGQGFFKQLGLRIEASDAVQPVIADLDMLQQVLINLLINARDAMPDGGDVRIAVRNDMAGAGAQMVLIEVTDSGSGIPEEHFGKIFDPFFTTKDPGRGTGLGLAISARIIDSFGGRITVANAPGGGACFTVRLPAAEQVKA